MEKTNELNATEVYLALNGATLTLQLIIEGLERDQQFANQHPAACKQFLDRTADVYTPLLESLFVTLGDLRDKADHAA